MSALTSIFNFLYVYLRCIIAYIMGNKIYSSDFSGECLEIMTNIVRSVQPNLTENWTYITLNRGGEPILMVVIGVFAVGSIIGLVRRLMK